MEKLAAEIAHNMESWRETKPLQTEIYIKWNFTPSSNLQISWCLVRELAVIAVSSIWRTHGFVAEELWGLWGFVSQYVLDCMGNHFKIQSVDAIAEQTDWKEQLASILTFWASGWLTKLKKSAKTFMHPRVFDFQGIPQTSLDRFVSPGPELIEIRHPGAVRTVGAASWAPKMTSGFLPIFVHGMILILSLGICCSSWMKCGHASHTMSNPWSPTIRLKILEELPTQGALFLSVARLVRLRPWLPKWSCYVLVL